jgi:murein DD-endopeptidase MepM/ murein hydrolase activator NlpD
MSKVISSKIFFIAIASQALNSCVTQQPAPIEFKGNYKVNDTTEYYVAQKNDIITTNTIDHIPSQQKSSGYLGPDILEESAHIEQFPLKEEPMKKEVQSAEKGHKQQTKDTNNELNKELDNILAPDTPTTKQTIVLQHAPEPEEVAQEITSNPQELQELQTTPAKDPAKDPARAKEIIPSKFINPVDGNIIKNFNAEHQGINIAANLGDEVRAIGQGQVVYSGYDGKFGNLIIIKLEEGGLFAAFAHLDDLIMTKGQSVTQGQVIGHVGQSGNIEAPTLYLALKKGKTPVDPVSYLHY